MKKLLLCMSAAVLLLTACDKNDDDEPSNITPTVANLTGSFKQTGETLSGTNIFDNQNSSMNIYQPCERDDIYTLASYSAPATSGTLTVTDAGTQCNPQSGWTGTWSLTNPSTINLDGEVWTISSYNGTTLHLTQTFQGQPWTRTYVKQ